MLIKCAPDHDGCIDLLAVMRIMSQIDQEQAWALAYQLAALMQRLWPAGNNCATIESLAQIYINQEGFVHEKTLLMPHAKRPEEPASRRRRQQQQQQQQQQQRMKRPAGQAESAESDKGNELEAAAASANKSDFEQVSARAGCEEAPAGNQDEPASKTTTTSASRATKREQAGPRTSQSEQQQQQQHPAKLPPTPPITPELAPQARRRATSESELVSSLGIALFWALDYGIPEDEERKLGRTMEFLIVKSQNGHLCLDELAQICIKRLPVPTKAQADLHYRAICKALFADTIELSVLLDKIYTATMVMNGAAPAMGAVEAAGGPGQSDILRQQHSDYLHHHHLLQIGQDDLSELGLPLASLKALKINDWARLWMQVIRELRQRRKFILQQQQQQQQPPQPYGKERVELQTA